jgi:enamine deaminase RidA (YjgF/YER057c/UK114 family)
MSHIIREIGISHQIGKYSDTVEIRTCVGYLPAALPALEIDGTLTSDITGQAEVAGKHILRMLKQANMAIADVVKVTQFPYSDIAAYAK